MKKLKGKLNLNKKTIATLDTMSEVKGGETYTCNNNTCTCITCNSCLHVPGATGCVACMEPIESDGTCDMPTGAPCDPSIGPC